MAPVITVDESKCVNCHMCIAVCPVKYCIDGSGEKVAINADLCIGCGSCVAACTQHARTIRDDSAAFFEAIARREKIIGIAAPALAASFPRDYRRIIGWLKRIGVEACFDVSFGAELTVKSYVDHLRRNDPRLVIAQPCPAIVSYIEVYHPELIPYLAPADSPMLHTIKMVRDYYPQYRRHRVLVLSPCAAKRREFEETGLGDYNVTFQSFEAALKARGVDLSRVAEADFDNPVPERAVLFSTPGGLLRTAAREVPGIESRARKIEGPGLVYPYLAGLGRSLEKGTNPLLIDCLNCEYGCNAGPGTLNHGKSPDEFERPIEARKAEGERVWGGKRPSDRKIRARLDRVLSRYWRPGLYARAYVDRSSNYRFLVPTEEQLSRIYASMLKETDADHLDCASCGYKSCEGMAIAIFNGLNKKENCHLYRQRVIERERSAIEGSTEKLRDEIRVASGMIGTIQTSLDSLRVRSSGQLAALEQSAASVQDMIATLANASGMAAGKRAQIKRLADEALGGERSMSATIEAIRAVSGGVANIAEMIGVIDDVADKTNLLAMNAAIQAARASAAGKSFAVVASEIRSLAVATSGNARHITESLAGIVERIKTSDDLTGKTGEGIRSISRDVALMADEMGSLIGSLGEISSEGTQVNQGIDALLGLSAEVKGLYDSIAEAVGGILGKIGEIAAVSEEAQRSVDSIAER